jgi:hypothetical protein
MKNIFKYERFLESDMVEFPIKKYISIIGDNIYEKVEFGINEFKFDFSNEKMLPISFTININRLDIDRNWSGYIKENEVKSNFNDFGIYLSGGGEINYDQILSIIGHELKHVYDIYYGKFEDSFDKVKAYNYLLHKWSNNEYIRDFIEISNLSLKHELEARVSMIYNKLRWLKTFDDNQIKDEFKKTYVFKSLSIISEFNSLKIINNVKEEELIKFTNEYIKYFIGDQLKVISNRNELSKFYRDIEIKFKKTSDSYLKKCLEIIDELVIDKKPYMEDCLSKIIYKEWDVNESKHLDEFIYNYFQ